MKNDPSSAIENGLTAQLTNNVTPTPRQCLRTCPIAAKSTLSSIGTIMSQINIATGRLTLAISAEATAPNKPGMMCPSVTPATMQSATQSVRYRSNMLMGHATSFREDVAPSERPISRRRVPSESWSMFRNGRLMKTLIRFFR